MRTENEEPLKIQFHNSPSSSHISTVHHCHDLCTNQSDLSLFICSASYNFKKQVKPLDGADKEYSDWLGGKAPIIVSLPCVVSWVLSYLSQLSTIETNCILFYENEINPRKLLI